MTDLYLCCVRVCRRWHKLTAWTQSYIPSPRLALAVHSRFGGKQGADGILTKSDGRSWAQVSSSGHWKTGICGEARWYLAWRHARYASYELGWQNSVSRPRPGHNSQWGCIPGAAEANHEQWRPVPVLPGLAQRGPRVGREGGEQVCDRWKGQSSNLGSFRLPGDKSRLVLRGLLL